MVKNVGDEQPTLGIQRKGASCVEYCASRRTAIGTTAICLRPRAVLTSNGPDQLISAPVDDPVCARCYEAYDADAVILIEHQEVAEAIELNRRGGPDRSTQRMKVVLETRVPTPTGNRTHPTTFVHLPDDRM